MNATQPRRETRILPPKKALDPDWHELPIEKFSITNGSKGSKNHQWAHDTRQGIFLVFKKVRVPRSGNQYDERTEMGVTVNAMVLDQLYLEDLLQLSNRYEELCRQGMINVKVEANAVSIIQKDRILAISREMPGAKVRLIQFKFKQQKDAALAVRILQKHKLVVRDAVEKQSMVNKTPRYSELPELPQTARRNQVGPLSESSSISRPFSAFSTSDSSLFTRPESRDLGIVTTASIWPQDRFSSARPSSVPFMSDGIFQTPPSRPLSALDTTKSKSSIYVAQLENENRPFADIIPAAIPSDQGTRDSQQYFGQDSIFRRPESSFVFGQPAFSHNASRLSNTHFRISDEDQLRLRRSASFIDPSQGHFVAERTASYPLNSPRRYSSFSQDAHDYLGSWMPPKRDLPFQKGYQSSRTPIADLPPLPTPTPIFKQTSTNNCNTDTNNSVAIPSEPAQISEPVIDVHSNKDHPTVEDHSSGAPLIKTPPSKAPVKKQPAEPLNKRTISKSSSNVAPKIDQPEPPVSTINTEVRQELQEISKVREEEPSPLAVKSASIQRPSTAPALQSKTAPTRKRPARAAVKSIQPPNKKTKTMVDSSTQTETKSGREHTIPPILESANIASAEHEDAGPRVELLTDSYMDGIEDFVSRHRNRPLRREIWDTSSWEDDTTEERQQRIDDYLVDLIGDDDFAQLCEDVHNSWTRIGF